MRQNDMVNENIYGHLKRLHWIVSNINKEATIVEFGCGTGYMISLPLAKMGYTIFGIDLDRESIAFGQELFRKEGFNPNVLKTLDISELDVVPDVIIASEVFEHIQNEDLNRILNIIRNKLKPMGKLLITVPNGYGWFEMESFLWFGVMIGRLLETTKIISVIHKIKLFLLGRDIEPTYPATLSNSSHLQSFTFSSIQNLLQRHGFEVTNIQGSVLFAGPFSNLLFTGFKHIMKLNNMLGTWFPHIASGFYVTCRRIN